MRTVDAAVMRRKMEWDMRAAGFRVHVVRPGRFGVDGAYWADGREMKRGFLRQWLSRYVKEARVVGGGLRWRPAKFGWLEIDVYCDGDLADQ